MAKLPDMNTPLFKKGRAVRTAVVGAEYVDKALSTMNEFNAPMQKLVTEWCWGDVWGRPGISRQTRSMLNLAMLCALNRPHELRTHVRGALRNGVTPKEIQEVLLQVAVYCGVPAGIEGFRIATEVVNEYQAAAKAAGKTKKGSAPKKAAATKPEARAKA
jgi:4-carboxymuconolactone decarboxylase